MKIESITVREIQMPLVHYFETSFAKTTVRRILLVTLQSDGVRGWGECSAGENPFYSEESVDTAWQIIKEYLAPSFIGRNWERASDLLCDLPPVRGNNIGEEVLWRTQSGMRKRLLALSRCGSFSGGTRGRRFRWRLDWKSAGGGHTLEKIKEELASGYQRIKIKVKPGWDIAPLRAIRDRWPDITLSCDAN